MVYDGVKLALMSSSPFQVVVFLGGGDFYRRMMMRPMSHLLIVQRVVVMPCIYWFNNRRETVTLAQTNGPSNLREIVDFIEAFKEPCIERQSCAFDSNVHIVVHSLLHSRSFLH